MKKFWLFIVLVATLLCFAPPLFASQAETSIIVLSGDIGGTNARLRLTQLKNNEKHILANKTYKVADYDNSLTIIQHFLNAHKDYASNIDSLCLAVNEPVKNGKAWGYDAEQLKKDFKIDSVLLINDLEAVGYGIESLTEKDLYLLQEGIPEKNGLKAFIAAGTWLGMGFAANSGPNRSVIPIQIDQSFRSKSISDSDSNRSTIPVQTDR